MSSEQNKESYSKPLSEDESHALCKYGRLPHGGGMLRKQSKERTYFDSGDSAIAAAHRVTTDNGAIQTGEAHPHRDSISRPYAPVPAASNVDKDAGEDMYRRTSPEKTPLLQQANMQGEDAIEKERDNPISKIEK